MAYMLLIVEPVQQREERSEEEGRLLYEQMLRYTDDLKARGVLRASDSLKSHAEAARIEVRGGKRAVIDGPFAESKEMVGGFFYLDCATKAEAIAIASECPAAQWATVEVREVGPCYSR